jgi:hypothetical protein
MFSKLICKVFGHRWHWVKSYPFQKTGTTADLAMVPSRCDHCDYIPTPKEVVELAIYEGKVG